MNDNINTGANINAGDGGYSLGTQEKYDEFVKGRNQSLGKMRIKQLAEQAIEIVANKRTLADGQIEKTWQPEYFDQVFAQLIVKECMKVAVNKDSGYMHPADVAGYMAAGRSTAAQMIKEHFGVEEC
jgi:hypothetical protein